VLPPQVDPAPHNNPVGLVVRFATTHGNRSRHFDDPPSQHDPGTGCGGKVRWNLADRLPRPRRDDVRGFHLPDLGLPPHRCLRLSGRDIVIINGDAPGVDWAFSRACTRLGVATEVHSADWHTLGNITGPARNREMVQAGADLCVALHRDLAASKGTKDCVRQALAAGIPVYLIAMSVDGQCGCWPMMRG
jgi:hypothetical protein